MNPTPVPPELSCLNDFEKALIQRAKCFMTLIKLKPFRYSGPSNSLVKAKKGTAVHFNLPPAETVDYSFLERDPERCAQRIQIGPIFVDACRAHREIA